jgi:putative transposase
MLNLTYEYKLILTPTQTDLVERILVVCRKVWNYALRERKDWSASRKSLADRCSLEKEYIMSPDEPYPNYPKQCKQLTQARKKNEELKSVHSQVLQQVLRTLDRSFLDMKAKGFGFPRFKNRYGMRSFLFHNCLKIALKGISLSSLR